MTLLCAFGASEFLVSDELLVSGGAEFASTASRDSGSCLSLPTRLMDLLLFRHLWGVTEPLDTFLPSLPGKGYHGMEAVLRPGAPYSPAWIADQLAELDLAFIQIVWAPGNTVEEQITSLRAGVREGERLPRRAINIQGGVDAWPFEEQVRYYREATRLESDVGVPFYWETHRSRPLYTPWTTARLLEELPDLKLTADFSHWVCVAERFLEDQAETMAKVIPHVHHVHSRVGFPEGPQVTDPRAPEYAEALAVHERWWDMIWESQAKSGWAETTLTPEFGPYPYQHALPYTGQSVVDLAAVCDWMGSRQRDRFQKAREPRATASG